MLQQTQARLYPVVPLGCDPAQKLANLVPQLAATELRRTRNRFLNVDNPSARQPLAEKRGRLELLDLRRFAPAR